MTSKSLKEWVTDINNFLQPKSLTSTLTLSQCTNGAYTRCWKIGRVVTLSFNINITTATSSYDYIRGLPKPVEGGWACSGVQTGNSNVMRFWITPDGTLRTDGYSYAGWVNGSVTYICQ